MYHATTQSIVPRKWEPDHSSEFCSNCNDKFTPINRKHHCRACGRLLCADCSSHWLLIPKDKIIFPDNETVDKGPVNVFASNLDSTFNTPQRCCTSCSCFLDPLQKDLREMNSRGNKDLVFGRDSHDRYLNAPISRKLETDIKKASYTLYNFSPDNKISGEDTIPRELLIGCKGIVFLTILKAGFLFSGRIGTGLVVSRLKDGSWSAPSALMITGAGWGFQAGGELTDVILVLTTSSAVQAFSSKTQISVGTELAVSLGPVGRSAGTDVHASNKGASAAFSYAHSKGLFFGVSLEASVFTVRPDINRKFYGEDIKPARLLNGDYPRPKAAERLYKALDDICGSPDSHLGGYAYGSHSSFQSQMQYDSLYPSNNEELYDTGDDNENLPFQGDNQGLSSWHEGSKPNNMESNNSNNSSNPQSNMFKYETFDAPRNSTADSEREKIRRSLEAENSIFRGNGADVNMRQSSYSSKVDHQTSVTDKLSASLPATTSNYSQFAFDPNDPLGGATTGQAIDNVGSGIVFFDVRGDRALKPPSPKALAETRKTLEEDILYSGESQNSSVATEVKEGKLEEISI